MTAIAYATHQTMIVDQGIKPDSPEYFETLDATMRQRFPEYEWGDKKPPPNVVASADKTVSGNTRTVRLTPSQKAVANSLGIPVESYAKQLLKESGAK